jgi:hypothetical protein
MPELHHDHISARFVWNWKLSLLRQDMWVDTAWWSTTALPQSRGIPQVQCTHIKQDTVVSFHGHQSLRSHPHWFLSMRWCKDYGIHHWSEFCRRFVAASTKCLSTGQENIYQSMIHWANARVECHVSSNIFCNAHNFINKILPWLPLLSTLCIRRAIAPFRSLSPSMYTGTFCFNVGHRVHFSFFVLITKTSCTLLMMMMISTTTKTTDWSYFMRICTFESSITKLFSCGPTKLNKKLQPL